jgi:hypothetical protein
MKQLPHSILVSLVLLTMIGPGRPRFCHGQPSNGPAHQSGEAVRSDFRVGTPVNYVAPLSASRTGEWDDMWNARFLDFFHDVLTPTDADFVIRGQDGGGGGDLAGDATNPMSNLTQYQVQNTFVPSTYEASGYANTVALQMVKPIETGSCFFPTWVTRTTLPVISTADPDGAIPIGPPNDNDFLVPLDDQAGLGDMVFISILNHPTDWGSWGIGPGLVAPTATRAELGEQSWKFSPTFAVVNTSIPTWQFGILGIYHFPLDQKGSKVFQFQPLIVKQLGDGWYTGWGDDLWAFNTDSGSFAMPLQLRLGKVHKFGRHSYNLAATSFYTPDELRNGPTAEWGIKLSVTLLMPN